MLTTRDGKPAAQKAERKSEGADTAPDSKLAAKLNPIWQQVATQAAAVRPKLAVSRPDDPDEREADRAADLVMRMPTPQPINSQLSLSSVTSPTAHRKCAPCEEEEDKKLQRQGQCGSSGTPATAPPIVHEALSSSGRPLEPTTRAFFESRFGHDFGGVRVHDDAQAAESARAVNALAYTVGRDVVFGAEQYDPMTSRGRSLLAHELAHFVQQRGVNSMLHRQAACPTRPQDEATNSRTAGGILPENVAAGPNRIDVQDFAVGSDALPPGVTGHTEWQRAMSILAGDPSIIAQVIGYTDCVGTQAENISLRRTRITSVLAAMPATARARIPPVLTYTLDATSFLDTNATPEGRARNRAVRLQWLSAPPRGQQACDLITGAAANLDQYIFLVSCVESRLGLTAPADARTVLSVLRQIYFGTGSWSLKPNAVWGDVITSPSWSPGTDPTPRLGATLMRALRASDVVEGIDVSHLFTGLDAMLNPHIVTLTAVPSIINVTNVPNEEWATWAGDVGSAAAEWVVDTVFTPPSTPLDQATYFRRFAGDDDLRGNLDAFAVRAGFNPGGTPSSRLMQAMRLTGTLSESLRQYYRLTSSALGRNRSRATRDFVEAYGGVLSGNTVTNRAALAARLRPSVRQFALMFMMRNLLRRGFFGGAQLPPGAPLPNTLIDPAIDAMIDRFITWLEQHP